MEKVQCSLAIHRLDKAPGRPGRPWKLCLDFCVDLVFLRKREKKTIRNLVFFFAVRLSTIYFRLVPSSSLILLTFYSVHPNSIIYAVNSASLFTLDRLTSLAAAKSQFSLFPPQSPLLNGAALTLGPQLKNSSETMIDKGIYFRHRFCPRLLG